MALGNFLYVKRINKRGTEFILIYFNQRPRSQRAEILFYQQIKANSSYRDVTICTEKDLKEFRRYFEETCSSTL